MDSAEWPVIFRPFNAVRASLGTLRRPTNLPRPGKVVIRSFSSRSRGRVRANVDIIDNGAGMSAEAVRERLLHPFQTTKENGVGLGLWTAGQIVRHHKGTLRILSQPGGGTVVRLTFPAAGPAAS